MEALSSKNSVKKGKFQLYKHPWLSLLSVYGAIILSNVVVGTIIFGFLKLPDESSWVQFVQGISYQILTVFVLVPFVLHLPKGKRTFKAYLEDIGLSMFKPFLALLLLALSCYLLLALSQVAATLIFRSTERFPITVSFFRQVLDISGDLPPKSASLFISIPSMFEEVVFRGIVLTSFLKQYSPRKSIIFSSLGFGLIHLLNLLMGRELIWIIGQVSWAFSIGLFYGYVFVKTKSLLPSMIVHYLGNVFIGSFTWYLQCRTSIEIQALYGVLFSFGILPTTLMILWTKFYASRWFPRVAGGHSSLV
jgi:membrane protease YdiL (CAAX protease family)